MVKTRFVYVPFNVLSVHSREAEVTGQLRLYGKYGHLRYCTLDDRSLAVLVMCLHPQKISHTYTQRVADAFYLSCRNVISIY